MKGYKLKGFGRNHVIPHEINRPKSIIVTFPVVFLVDLGNSVLRRDYELAWKTRKPHRLRNYKRKGKEVEFPEDVFLNSKKNLIKLGFKECIRQIEAVNEFNMENPDTDEPMLWWHSMGNRPKEVPEFCYVNILSKIRYKFRVIDLFGAGEMVFNDLRKRTGKHWLAMIDPVKLEPAIKMGGFQGFRYWKENYQKVKVKRQK